MKKSIIKILYSVDSLSICNGVLSVAMNYSRNLNCDKFKIDFLVVNKISEGNDTYANEIKKYGGKIYKIGINYSLKNVLKIRKYIKKFYFKYNYDIVELHVPTLSYLLLRKGNFTKNKPIRIIHTHSSIKSANKVKNFINSVLNFNIKKYGDYYFGCSIDSGKYWFGNEIVKNSKFYVIPNGTNIEKYSFDSEKRQELRKKFQIEDKIALGFVGRISKDKNLDFIIDVIKKINNNNIKLFLIGKEGNASKSIDKLLKGQDSIELLGFRKDTNELYNMLDCIVLCSKKEGLPMVAVEAQLNGLNCILSDTITKEVNIGLCEYILLDKNKWIEAINNIKALNIRNCIDIQKKKFDIKANAKELEKIYDRIVRSK